MDGSDNWGQTAAVLTSLIATCKRLKIDPFAYLRDLFGQIAAHSNARIEELLPDQWKTTPGDQLLYLNLPSPTAPSPSLITPQWVYMAGTSGERSHLVIKLGDEKTWSQHLSCSRADVNAAFCGAEFDVVTVIQ